MLLVERSDSASERLGAEMDSSRRNKNVGIGVFITLLSASLLLMATALPSSGFTILFWVVAFFGFLGATYLFGREVVAKRDERS